MRLHYQLCLFVILLSEATVGVVAHSQAEVTAVSASQLAEKPDAYNGKSVRVHHMHCADVDYGFTCRANAAPFVLKIDGRALGKLATDRASTRMAEHCEGEPALKSKLCEFDVIITPISNDYTILPTSSGS